MHHSFCFCDGNGRPAPDGHPAATAAGRQVQIEPTVRPLKDDMYRFSFFFWPESYAAFSHPCKECTLHARMDLLGTLSMAFEISFLLGQYLNSNTAIA